MRYLAIFAAGGALVATPALAQERAPFTGPHVEALGGYEHIRGGDGAIYGVGAGYDFQVGQAIAGVEGELSDSTTKRHQENLITAGDDFRVNRGRSAYIGGRIGIAAGSTLFYAKAGYANTRVNTRYTDGTGTARRHANVDGYRIGAGIEQKMNIFGPSGFVKAEYRYSNYENQQAGSIGVRNNSHQAVVGLGVRF